MFLMINEFDQIFVYKECELFRMVNVLMILTLSLKDLNTFTSDFIYIIRDHIFDMYRHS